MLKIIFFFFSSRRRHTRLQGDWSSDVCSSDLRRRRGTTMNDAVGWAGLAVSLLLVAVAAGISWWQRLGLQRQILVAAVRALVQLLLVGAALTLVISPGRSIWWSWLWVTATLGYAATVARRRAPEVPHLLTLALASFAAA